MMFCLMTILQLYTSQSRLIDLRRCLPFSDTGRLSSSTSLLMVFLQDMMDSNEQQLKPTPFIQSTHNTIASLIAILTGNHGYNATYSQGTQSLACALIDIQTQMTLGMINNALVLEFDEQVDAWDQVLQKINDQTHDIARASIYKNPIQ